MHTAVVFVPPNPLHDHLIRICLTYVARRGYALFRVVRDWRMVDAALDSNQAQVVVFATRTHSPGAVDRAEYVDEETTRIMYQRNAAVERHQAPQSLTESGVRRIISGDEPVPVGLDPESIAAARRIWKHFGEHGCA